MQVADWLHVNLSNDKQIAQIAQIAKICNQKQYNNRIFKNINMIPYNLWLGKILSGNL